MNRQSFRSLALVVVTALVAGACGGGSGAGVSAPTQTAPPPTPPPPPPPPPVSALPPTPPTLTPPPVVPLACSLCKKIAFTSKRDGNSEIYSVNPDGTGLMRLTNHPAEDRSAAWSPDGQRLAFISDRNGGHELFVMNADGSNAVVRTPGQEAFEPTWSADGTRIAYSAFSAGSANIWVVGADSGAPGLLFSTPGSETTPDWSPDGLKLAFYSDWFAYDFPGDVFVVNADGSGFKAISDGNIFERTAYTAPSWSPNGTQLATTVVYELGIDQYVSHLAVMNADGSDLTRLIETVNGTRSSWSPGGTMIAFTSYSSGGYNLSWVRADGSGQGTIVADGWDPNWQR